MLERSLDADFGHSKIAQVHKSLADPKALSAVKKTLHRYYLILKQVFRHYSTLYTTLTNVFVMGWGAFTEFVQDCNVCDDQQCQMKDVARRTSAKHTVCCESAALQSCGLGISLSLSSSAVPPPQDTIFIAANVSGGHEDLDKAQRARNPDRSLTRYEFAEAVVRISIQKYFNKKQPNEAMREPSVSAALNRFVQKHVLPRAQYDRHATTFRKDVLWRQDVDAVVKERLPQLTKLYKHFHGRYALPGEVKFMSVEEFCEMLEGAGLLSGTQNDGGEPGANVLGGFGEREVKLCFVYAPVVNDFCRPKAYFAGQKHLSSRRKRHVLQQLLVALILIFF